jgi:hypothetical protein
VKEKILNYMNLHETKITIIKEEKEERKKDGR